jgi:uncharacterized membrane protein YjgN (DUF898 family)
MFTMRMTSFSNVRFSFVGSLRGAYINFMLLLTAFFLGLYGMPLLVFFWPSLIGIGGGFGVFVYGIISVVLAIYLAALTKNKSTSYVINGYRFGQGQFQTNIETHAFVKMLLKIIGLSLLMLLIFVISLVIVIFLTSGAFMPSIIFSGDSQAISDLFLKGSVMVALGLLYLVFLLSSFIVVAYFQAQVRQYVFGNTLLNSKVSFSSSLTTTSLAWLMMSNFILVIMTLGLATPWAKVRRVKLVLNRTLVDVESGFDGYITQQKGQQSALGEQIGDAFDVDIGVGV